MSFYHNQVQLSGRAGHDPSLQQLSDGTYVLRLKLYQDVPEADARGQTPYFHLVAWGRLAETLFGQIKRGNNLFVQGRLRVRELESEGVRRQRTEVHLDHFLRLSSRHSRRERPQNQPA